MSVTNKIVVWGSNPNQYDSGNPYQPDANGNEKGFTPGTLNYALYLNKALRNASIVPHALAQMLTHSPVVGNLDINFDINPGDIPTFDTNFRSAFDAYVKSTIKVDNATHADSADACTGNSATATKLQTARTIGGVSFDGSANINLPGVNTTGNQDTTGNAATATKATGDASGNDIKATYGSSLEVTNATSSTSAKIKLKNKNGTVITSLSLSKVSNAFNADTANAASYAYKLNGLLATSSWSYLEIPSGFSRANFHWTQNDVYEFYLSCGSFRQYLGIMTMITSRTDENVYMESLHFDNVAYPGTGASDNYLRFEAGPDRTGIIKYMVRGSETSIGLTYRIYYRKIQAN